MTSRELLEWLEEPPGASAVRDKYFEDVGSGSAQFRLVWTLLGGIKQIEPFDHLNRD